MVGGKGQLSICSISLTLQSTSFQQLHNDLSKLLATALILINNQQAFPAELTQPATSIAPNFAGVFDTSKCEKFVNAASLFYKHCASNGDFTPQPSNDCIGILQTTIEAIAKKTLLSLDWGEHSNVVIPPNILTIERVSSILREYSGDQTWANQMDIQAYVTFYYDQMVQDIPEKWRSIEKYPENSRKKEDIDFPHYLNVFGVYVTHRCIQHNSVPQGPKK